MLSGEIGLKITIIIVCISPKNRLDKPWCMQAFCFHYDCDAFEELCSDIHGLGLFCKH